MLHSLGAFMGGRVTPESKQRRSEKSMFDEITASWMFVALIESCVGSAMAFYGWKQRDSLSLVFGIVLTLAPGLVSNAWILASMGLGLVILFFVVKKALR